MNAPLIRFTQEQAAAVMGWRRVFNAQQRALAQSVEQMFAGNAAAIEFAGNALAIPIDAWRRIDARAQLLARSRLAVWSRLAAANTQPISIADLVNFYPQISDSNEVTFSMDGRIQAKADQANVKYVGTPVPVATATAKFGWRQMEVIRKGGGMLDIATIANAQRKMMEAREDMVINGKSSIVVGTDTIYGLRTLPTRNTGTHGLTLASATGAQWVTAFTQAINLAIGDNQFGQLTVFINYADYVAADTKDYVNGSNVTQGTILQRLMQMRGIKEIVPASSVPANEILGIADLEAGEWGAILEAMPTVTRPKTRLDPEEDYVFTVMAAGAPQLRSDYNGQSAFVHLTTA